ncbi:N-acetyltransferase [Streptomyces minutiscleroticus]|uniref:N-acetyltransferase n=1 Tax=Streptomyces minutiscleroticus TaxID=68238 RepID=A0A918KBC5_9ACTN|nr:GNAT family N-acetyltransferase [Streptomyces minutiscleroticus]GGX57001.1 N-acetyltransferase [Streptomyces minutiscleroticus]
MEISANFRLEVRITASDVGKRVSVRRLDEHAAEGEKFTDTVGVLTSWDDGVLLITRKSGEAVRIPESSLVAGKVVPAAPARRRGPSATYGELARVAARGWRPVEREPLGDWELRAASGFTRRANSVLPLGDPGMPLDEALAAVRRWYAARGLPAYLQIATGAEDTQELLGAELAARGWTREVTAELWTGALAPVGDAAGAADGPRVVLSRSADEAWLARYQRRGVSEVALRVLGGGPSVWFASVPSDTGAPAAIGRCVVDGRWAGFAAVEVAPEHRRRGLATAVMAALARRALDEGASAAWLQVKTDNTGARALYQGMGFALHHAYHHYREPAGTGAGAGTDAGAEAGGAGRGGRAEADGGRSSDHGEHPRTGAGRPVADADSASAGAAAGSAGDRYRSG